MAFAQEACVINGFLPAQTTSLHGIAAPTSGIALFPRQYLAGQQWGLEPVFFASNRQRRKAIASGRYDEQPMIALEELVRPYERIDLLHIDIQSGERDFIIGCMPAIQARVAYLLIGTHSRQIDGQILDIMLDAGWRLEIERPAIFDIVDGRPQIQVD